MMRLIFRIVSAIALAVVVAIPLAGQGPPPDTKLPPLPHPHLPLVTSQDLLDGFKNPERWLTFSGNYSGQRHSPLKQITPDNVRRLTAQWTFQAEGMAIGRGFEATPLILDGVMYVSGTGNYAWAVDMRTGRQIWRYRRVLPSGLTYGGGNPANRGLAALGDRLFMGTLDAHLIALDRNTGQVVWDVPVDDFKTGHAITAAPLVIKDKVIVGNSGGDLPTRGFLDAYDAGDRQTCVALLDDPGPGEPGSETWSDAAVLPRGGGATWMTGSYDPGTESDLLGHRQSEPRLLRAGSAGRQPVHGIAHCASMPTRASCAGISSSRRTTCTTGIPTTCRCSPTSRSAARRARS